MNICEIEPFDTRISFIDHQTIVHVLKGIDPDVCRNFSETMFAPLVNPEQPFQMRAAFSSGEDKKRPGSCAYREVVLINGLRTHEPWKEGGDKWREKVEPLPIDLKIVQLHQWAAHFERRNEWTTLAISLSDGDGNVPVGVFDIDNKGNTDFDAALRKTYDLSCILDREAAPYFVARSGSGDGFHIYVPMRNATPELFDGFMLHVRREAGYEGDKTVEIFPVPGAHGERKVAPVGGRKSELVTLFESDGDVYEMPWIGDPTTCRQIEFEIPAKYALAKAEPKAKAKPAPKLTSDKYPTWDTTKVYAGRHLLLLGVACRWRNLQEHWPAEDQAAMAGWLRALEADLIAQNHPVYAAAGGQPYTDNPMEHFVTEALKHDYVPLVSKDVKPLQVHFNELKATYPKVLLYGNTTGFYRYDVHPDVPPMGKDNFVLAERWRVAIGEDGKQFPVLPAYLKSQTFRETICTDFTMAKVGSDAEKGRVNLARPPKLEPWPDHVVVDENSPGVYLYFHIMREWLDMDPDEVEWNVMFDADTVQRYWEMTGHRYRVLKGTNGIFKSSLSEIVDILMLKFAAFTKADEWDSQFNKPLIGAARCTIEEAVFAQSPKVMNEIKGRTGQAVLNARLMRTDAFPVHNVTRFTFSINEDHFGFTTDKERRGSIFECRKDWDVTNNPAHQKLKDRTVILKREYLASEEQQRNLLTFLLRKEIDYKVINTPIINVARQRELSTGNRVVTALTKMVEAGAPLHNKKGDAKVSFKSLLEACNEGEKHRWKMTEMRKALKMVADDLQLDLGDGNGVQKCRWQERPRLQLVESVWTDMATSSETERGIRLPDINTLSILIGELNDDTPPIPGAIEWENWKADPREGRNNFDPTNNSNDPETLFDKQIEWGNERKRLQDRIMDLERQLAAVRKSVPNA